MPRPKPPPRNYISDAVQRWLASLPPLATLESEDSKWKDELLSSAPKRFTIYEPMALLPSGSFSSVIWKTALNQCPRNVCDALWSLILEELSKAGRNALTHLAVNEGIPLHSSTDEEENIMRSPSGLRMLYGDFGKSSTSGGEPSRAEFESAFWVSTKQNGIYQTWAPRWTMFSRGNVKEKARLLGLGAAKPSVEDARWAVDLYAGIGYFVFCYASLGMKVLGWEINPWSVEGLRRGAEANRWGIRVVEGSDLELPMEELIAGGERIVVFLEDNQKALARIQALWALDCAREVSHVNCGFLPTSQPTWEHAWEITRHSFRACLHLHENVGVADVESRKSSIQEMFARWTAAEGVARAPTVGHVEFVKTFAPGVWHCVFDVDIIS
ncbi:tRNA wybutosine-synthesizing protein 2 [Paramyrothecium foliicola]|nr:tRNA wybutosine-synthesizing protein 2 [Paramyrothecium foliicola]